MKATLETQFLLSAVFYFVLSWHSSIVLQTASSSIFSIGSQQTKCVRQFTTKEVAITSLTNILKLVRLVWVDNRTVIMLTVDGSETKYSV